MEKKYFIFKKSCKLLYEIMKRVKTKFLSEDFYVRHIENNFCCCCFFLPENYKEKKTVEA